MAIHLRWILVRIFLSEYLDRIFFNPELDLPKIIGSMRIRNFGDTNYHYFMRSIID